MRLFLANLSLSLILLANNSFADLELIESNDPETSYRSVGTYNDQNSFFTADYNLRSVNLTLRTTAPISVQNASSSDLYTLPSDSEIQLNTTLDQIYRSAQNSNEYKNLFSNDMAGTNRWSLQKPQDIKMQILLNQLVDLKMQENVMNAASGHDGSGDSSDDAYDREKRKIKVKIKEKGKSAYQEVKIDLKQAIEDKKIRIDPSNENLEESDILDTAIDSDYDGTTSWSADKNKTEGRYCFIFCSSEKSKSLAIGRETFESTLNTQFRNYSESSQVNRLIDHAKKNKRNPDEYRNSKKRYCYKYVKNSLLAVGLVQTRPQGVRPRYAGDQLEKEGFRNLLEDKQIGKHFSDPKQAPKGAILVYEPVPSDRMRVEESLSRPKRQIWVPDYGHIEIKTEESGKPGFVSDYYSESSRTGSSLQSKDRKLIGVYVKDVK